MPNDVKSLSVFARAEDGRIVDGLTGKTYWNYLDVSFLWVHEKYRGAGHATALIAAAESLVVFQDLQAVMNAAICTSLSPRKRLTNASADVRRRTR